MDKIRTENSHLEASSTKLKISICFIIIRFLAAKISDAFIFVSWKFLSFEKEKRIVFVQILFVIGKIVSEILKFYSICD